MYEIVKDPKFDEFFNGLTDEKTKAKITASIFRLGLGNPGKSEPVGQGVHELKIDYGPGWRIYYLKIGKQIVVLLGGGTKNGQQKDIDAAKERARTYRKP
jgi:putative addiction module killer protein